METTIIVTTPENLHNMIKEAVQAALAESLPKAIEQANRKPYLTKDD